MDNGKKFELESCEFLNQRYAKDGWSFESHGDNDSSSNDILVHKHGKHVFSIEAKLSPAQAGQIVVLLEQNRFSFSQDSKFMENEMTKKLIQYLNDHIAQYKEVGQRGIPIACEQKELFEWIKDHYATKGVAFVITSTKLHDYKAIFPLEQMERYFVGSVCLRRKKSGTSHLPRYRMDEAIESLHSYLAPFGAKIVSVETVKAKSGSKVLVKLDKKLNLKKSERSFGTDLFLSPVEQGFYIKVKSGTNNPNIMFSVKFIGNPEEQGFEEFERVLR